MFRTARMGTDMAKNFIRTEDGWRCPNCGIDSGPVQPTECPSCHWRPDGQARWWRYIVLRGDGIPADLDGRWYDLDAVQEAWSTQYGAAQFSATNRWEQRDDGAVAVVYEWSPHR